MEGIQGELYLHETHRLDKTIVVDKTDLIRTWVKVVTHHVEEHV